MCFPVDRWKKSQTTPGLWKHDTRPISFSLVVDEKEVKYVGEEKAQHLLDTVRQYYKCSCDWEGERYCGITIKWDYEGRKVHLAMPGYLPKALTCLNTLSQAHCKTNRTPTSSPTLVGAALEISIRKKYFQTLFFSVQTCRYGVSYEISSRQISKKVISCVLCVF